MSHVQSSDQDIIVAPLSVIPKVGSLCQSIPPVEVFVIPLVGDVPSVMSFVPSV